MQFLQGIFADSEGPDNPKQREKERTFGKMAPHTIKSPNLCEFA